MSLFAYKALDLYESGACKLALMSSQRKLFLFRDEWHGSHPAEKS
jgi:hypothetical protein